MKTLLASSTRVGLRYPAPSSPILAWFVGGATDVPEIAEGLRSTVFRRMSSLIAVFVSNAAMMVIAVTRHPDDLLKVWGEAGLCFEACRLVIFVCLIRAIGGGSLPRRRGLVDIFVASSLVWGGQIGLSCFLFLRSGDPVLTAFSVLLAVAVVGAMSARSPGSPRLCVTQMTCIVLLLTAGVLAHGDPTVRLLGLMAPSYLVGMITIAAQLHRDYVDMLTAQHENRRRALHCGLTGLANGGFFHERLSEILAAPGGTSVAVLALDLDGFKGVNDRYGHLVGDELLKTVAARLRTIESHTVMVARIGGDEFAVLLCGEDADAAERQAERLIRDIAAPYRLSEGTAVISASIGIARRRDGEGDRVSLYAQADRALYRAKAAGKGMWWRDEAPSAGVAEEDALPLRRLTAAPPAEAEPRAA